GRALPLGLGGKPAARPRAERRGLEPAHFNNRPVWVLKLRFPAARLVELTESTLCPPLLVSVSIRVDELFEVGDRHQVSADSELIERDFMDGALVFFRLLIIIAAPRVVILGAHPKTPRRNRDPSRRITPFLQPWIAEAPQSLAQNDSLSNWNLSFDRAEALLNKRAFVLRPEPDSFSQKNVDAFGNDSLQTHVVGLGARDEL